MKRILVLSSAESDYTIAANQTFVTEIQNLMGDQIEIVSKHYNDLGLEITSESIDVFNLDTHETIADFDFVYFKSYYRYSEMAVAIVAYLQQQDITYICHELDEAISFSKLTQYARMSRAHLPIAKTLFLHTKKLAGNSALVEQSLGFPCVMKAIDGKGGDLNFLIHDAEELKRIAGEHKEVDFVLQQFISNTYDLRVLVARGVVRLIIKRQRIDESTHLNNTSQGAQATLMDVSDLSQEATELAIKGAELFKRDIAGVDVMFETGTGTPYLLEVNASPQVATGAFQNEKLKVYATLFTELLDIDK